MGDREPFVQRELDRRAGLGRVLATEAAVVRAEAAAAPSPGLLREENRLVSVLFGEISGGLGFLQLDPEDLRDEVRQALAELIYEVELLGGTVTSVSGAGLAAVLGAPIAHEDDPERALNAALAMLERTARLDQRWRGRAGDLWKPMTRDRKEDSMSHVDEGTLHAYLDGELPSAERATLERHIETCATCREEIAGMKQVSYWMRALKPEQPIQPAPGFYARVMQQVGDRKPAPTFSNLFALDLAFGRRLAFGCLLTLAVLGSYLVTRETGEPAALSPEVVMAQQDAPALDATKAHEAMLATLTRYEP